jgi:hypothetical protein
MDYLFLLYILVAVGIGIGGPYLLVQTDRTLAAFLFFVGAVLVLTFYGLRWFEGDSLKAPARKASQWPPVLNACPDFLTLTTTGTGTNARRVCVDLVGVSTGGLMKTNNLTQVNESNNNYIFNLHENLRGQARINRLCQECKEKGVTWEGVFDGVSCTGTTYGKGVTGANGEAICPPLS